MMIEIEIDDSLARRFWASVRKGASCWEWTRKKDRWGYGQITMTGQHKFLKAHRVSFVIHNGPIPQGMNVLHTCDNPSCVRPDHLWLGTIADNNRDARQKGRAGYGRQNVKLTPAIVTEIRCMRATGATFREIAARYGIHRSQAHRIAAGIHWKELK